MRNHYNSTIAAISTAMSNSGIGIVRMSGPDSFEIADKIYKGKKEKKIGQAGFFFLSVTKLGEKLFHH